MVEKSVPDPLGCFADAFPAAKYYWQFEGLEEEEEEEEDREDVGGYIDFDGDEGRRNRGPLLSAPNASISEGPLRHFRHPVSRRKVLFF